MCTTVKLCKYYLKFECCIRKMANDYNNNSNKILMPPRIKFKYEWILESYLRLRAFVWNSRW